MNQIKLWAIQGSKLTKNERNLYTTSHYIQCHEAVQLHTDDLQSSNKVSDHFYELGISSQQDQSTQT